MRRADRTILLALVALALVAGFWFAILGPKRAEVSTLDDEIEDLRTSVEQQERLAVAAEASKADYESNYHRLVVLGKAVPSGDDTASLFVELEQIANSSGVALEVIKLNESGAPAPVPATPAAETTADGAEPAEPATNGEPAAPAAPASATAPATEAGAAVLPLGATVGPAGLPVMPYDLELRGDFFQLADFLAALDRLVESKHGRQVVDGRLLTIDGFALTGDEEQGFPKLTAHFAITTYVTPADQGATAGASSAGPAPTTPATTPTTTPAPAPEVSIASAP